MTDAAGVTMTSPSGATYDLVVTWGDIGGDRRLLAVLDPADLPALDHDELFHLVPAARPALLNVEPGLPTLLELRPDSALDGGDDVPAGAWLAERPDRRSTARWFVAALSQPDATAPTRTRTLWDHTPSVGPDADPATVLSVGAAFLHEQHPDDLAGIADLGGLSALFGAALGTPGDVDPLPVLEAVLTASDVEVDRLDDDALAFSVQGRHGRWVCLAEVSRRSGVLALYSVVPHDVAPPRLAEAWELVGRFNADRVSGTVQLDAATGRTVVRTSLVLGGRPSRAVVRRLLELALDNGDEAVAVFARFAAGASLDDALATSS